LSLALALVLAAAKARRSLPVSTACARGLVVARSVLGAGV